MRCDSCYKETKKSELNPVTKGCCHEKVEDVYCDSCYNNRYETYKKNEKLFSK